MLNSDDTIVAVSSPTGNQRTIIRITGPGTSQALGVALDRPLLRKTGIIQHPLFVAKNLPVGAFLYLFQAPHSYTSQMLAEVHVYSNSAVAQAFIDKLLNNPEVPVRLAGPGEFTARAYLNGKMDLAQAEAVCEIIAGSNKFQLDAAQKLLAGRLSETTAKAKENLMDCLGLIEAGLDFSGEDIEFQTVEQATEKLAKIKTQLERLLNGSISYETMIDLPSVGITGAPNAGKSSLLNRLLGAERSIVSPQRKTTRDVLTGVLKLKTSKCVLFDCAGLTAQPNDILEELAQQVAIEAIHNAAVILYCVDVSKPDWSEDALIRKFVNAKTLVPVATKMDLLTTENLKTQPVVSKVEPLAKLRELLGFDFLPVSSKTGDGINLLQKRVNEELIKLMSPAACGEQSRTTFSETSIALTERHKRAVADAIENTVEAIKELKVGNDEVAAMMLRAAIQSLSGIEHEHVDEQLLDRIFSRFCIGK